MAFGGLSFDDLPESLPKGRYLFEITDFRTSLGNPRDGLEGLGDQEHCFIECVVSENHEDAEFRGTDVRDIYFVTYPDTKPLADLEKDEQKAVKEAMATYRMLAVKFGCENSDAALQAWDWDDELTGKDEPVEFYAKVYVQTDKETDLKTSAIDLKSITRAGEIEKGVKENVDKISF